MCLSVPFLVWFELNSLLNGISTFVGYLMPNSYYEKNSSHIIEPKPDKDLKKKGLYLLHDYLSEIEYKCGTGVRTRQQRCPSQVR